MIALWRNGQDVGFTIKRTCGSDFWSGCGQVVTTWMGVSHLGSQYIYNQSPIGQLIVLGKSITGLTAWSYYPVYTIKQTSSELVEPVSSCKRGIRQGAFTCIGWQVTPDT